MKKCLVILFCLVGLATSQTANAGSITYSLTSDHCTDGCGPANTVFGSITLTDILGGVRMDVVLNSGFRFVSTGSSGATVGFNLNPDATISEGAGSTAGWDLVSGSPGSLHLDGFGDFQYGINCLACLSGGSNPQPSPLLFNILGAGVTIASFAELSIGSNQAFFAVDVISSLPGFTPNTGWVDASTPGTVPDGGSTAMLLGSVLFGLGMLRRRLGRN